MDAVIATNSKYAIDDCDQAMDEEKERKSNENTRWEKDTIAFTMFTAKIATTLISKHFGPDRTPVIVVYGSQWAESASLLQEHDGVYWPVSFESRPL